MQICGDIIIEDTAAPMTANIKICSNIMKGSNNRKATKNLFCVLTLVKPAQLGTKKGILAVFRCHKGKGLGVLPRTIDPVLVEIQGLAGKKGDCKHR